MQKGYSPSLSWIEPAQPRIPRLGCLWSGSTKTLGVCRTSRLIRVWFRTRKQIRSEGRVFFHILELNGTLNLPTGQFITWTLVRRSWILFTTLVTFALALVLACKRLSAVNSDLLFSQSDHCYKQRPVDFINELSLPYQINIVLHEAILNELDDSETLERLVLTRSKLYSSLKNKDLISRFACAIKEYFSKQVAPVFLNQITITKAQLDLIVYKVSELLDIYRLLESTYYKHESATAKAVQEVQLSKMHHYIIRAQS